MRYKQILKHFQDELDCEIANEKSLPHVLFLARQRASGNATDDDLVEIRGYYKGLKVAREMLQKQIAIQEEIEKGYEDE